MREIGIHEDADEEIKAAVAYYESCETGLGDAFFAEVLRGFDEVREHAFTWPVVFEEFRQYLLHRFPYAVVYRASEQAVFVLAVAHTRRKPGYWRERGAIDNLPK